MCLLLRELDEQVRFLCVLLLALNYSLGGFKCFANLSTVDDFLVELLCELDRCIVEYVLVCLHAENVPSTAFKEDLPDKLRVASCHKDDIQTRPGPEYKFLQFDLTD